MKNPHILRLITLKRYPLRVRVPGRWRAGWQKSILGAFKSLLKALWREPLKKSEVAIFALANAEKDPHLNEDGTFKGGFDGMMADCGGNHSEESAKKICGAIAQGNSIQVHRIADMHVVPPEETIEATRFSTVVANDSAISDDGWALIAPFGEHPKTRQYREGGQVRQQQFIQVLDNESADALVSDQSGIFKKFLRRWVGIPIYKGHGDLNDADPAAVANESQKIKLGVIDQVRKTARGIEAHFSLDNDGEKAVTQEGYKYPSAFWWVLPNGKRGDAILAKPAKLISVALTPHPNISGVESLANAKERGINSASLTPDQPNPNQKMITEKLMGRLIGMGRKLPANPTEDQLLDTIPNDMADGDADGEAASAKAHRASAAAAKNSTKDTHLKAAVAHNAASDAADDDKTSDMHDSMARYHTGMANDCK